MSPLIGYVLLGVIVCTSGGLAAVAVKNTMQAPPTGFAADVRAEIAARYDAAPADDSAVPAAPGTQGKAGAWTVNGKVAQCVASVGATANDVSLSCAGTVRP